MVESVTLVIPLVFLVFTKQGGLKGGVFGHFGEACIISYGMVVWTAVRLCASPLNYLKIRYLTKIKKKLLEKFGTFKNFIYLCIVKQKDIQ